MVLLPCLLKGKTLRLQSDPTGKKLGEYCFNCMKPCASFEDCLACRDRYCDYGFNLPPLRENKALRERVLKYVYDASLDDELLLEGITPYRDLRLRWNRVKGKFYSKPCYDEETGKRLMELDEAQLKAYRQGLRLGYKLYKAMSTAKPLPSRVIKRKERKKPDK